MNESTEEGIEIILVLLGPIGFVIFLVLHKLDHPMLKRLEQKQKSSRGAHGAIVTIWTIFCIMLLVIATSSGPVNQVAIHPELPEYTVYHIDEIKLETGQIVVGIFVKLNSEPTVLEMEKIGHKIIKEIGSSYIDIYQIRYTDGTEESLIGSCTAGSGGIRLRCHKVK